MIVCPNCEHQNPLGAVQCEACYTPLPAMTQCPNCGSANQTDAVFCGQCGFTLQMSAGAAPVAFEPLATPDPIVMPPPIAPVTPPAGATLGLTTRFPRSTGGQPTGSTQLQVPTAKLLHIQTDTPIELAPGLSVIHMGKPNDRIPPDIDLAGYPNSEIVSRIHADIRIEGDAYYIEDVGSSNGTYVNNAPLAVGSRHRLRPGDRIAFGKGDKVSFLFQL
jgi:pSer/pThr/pTyr-binding forkhead associated (FHA) protein/ribosomal protein L40E